VPGELAGPVAPSGAEVSGVGKAVTAVPGLSGEGVAWSGALVPGQWRRFRGTYVASMEQQLRRRGGENHAPTHAARARENLVPKTSLMPCDRQVRRRFRQQHQKLVEAEGGGATANYSSFMDAISAWCHRAQILHRGGTSGTPRTCKGMFSTYTQALRDRDLPEEDIRVLNRAIPDLLFDMRTAGEAYEDMKQMGLSGALPLGEVKTKAPMSIRVKVGRSHRSAGSPSFRTPAAPHKPAAPDGAQTTPRPSRVNG